MEKAMTIEEFQEMRRIMNRLSDISQELHDLPDDDERVSPLIVEFKQLSDKYTEMTSIDDEHVTSIRVDIPNKVEKIDVDIKVESDDKE